MNDTELYEKFRGRGDREAISSLFDRYAERVYNVVLSILRDPSRSEDVTQDVFVRLLEKRDSPTNFRPWLYRVAYNEALQSLRGEKRREQRQDRTTNREEAMPADEKAIREEVWKSVETLEGELRLPLLLRFQHGLSFAEIAEVLGRPQGTVARQVHEAKEELQQRLSPAFGVVESLPLQRISETLKGRLADLARHTAPTGSPKPWLAKVPLALAMGVPAMVIAVWAVSCAWDRKPTVVRIPEVAGPREATEERSPTPSVTVARETTPRKEASFSVGSQEATLRVVLTDPATGGPALDPLVVDARPVFNLDEMKREHRERVILKLREDQFGVYEGSVPCAGRTLVELSAIPKVADPRTQLMVRKLGWVAVGPGETVEKRFPLASVVRKDELKKLFLDELASSKRFGAIRGCTAQFPGSLKIEDASLDRMTFGFYDWGGRVFWESADRFLYIPVQEGETSLRLRDACCSQSVSVTVTAGRITDLGTLAHAPKETGVVSGVLVDEEGRPVSETRVVLSEADRHPDYRTYVTKTDPDGRFRLERLDPELRDPRLSVSPEGRFGVREFEVRIGQTDIVLRLPRMYSIFVKILPLGSDYSVEVLPKSDAKMGVSKIADRNGLIHLHMNAEAVPPGSVARLRLHKGKGKRTTTEWLVFQENATLEVTVEE